jgi:hypothetical protein
MFRRSLFVVATAVAATTMAVAPAMATDEPAPPSQQGVKSCVDNKRPVSRLSRNVGSTLRRGVIHGIAIDQGCGPAGTGQVRSVSVSISRRVGKRCQHLFANGRFSRAGSCATQVWLRARGRKTWTFRVGHRLRAGKYMVSSRAVDSAGNIERHAR